MADENKDKLRPTIVSPPARTRRAPAVEPGHPVPGPAKLSQTPTVLQPTVIAGTARERLPVTAADLRKLSPAAAKHVIDRALALLAGFVVEKASERKAILWGHDLQKTYSDSVAEALRLSQAQVIGRTQTHIARTLEILASFDLRAAAGHADEGFGRYFRRMNGKIDTVGELATARGELDQLVRLMGAALDELLRLKEDLEKNARALDEIAVEAEASVLAALHLCEHLRSTSPALADRFLERSASLTQTLAQIRSSGAVRDMQLEHPIRMIGAIQNVVLVSMPDFLSSLAAIAALAVRNASITPTQASELNYKLHDVIRQLKT